MLEEIMSAARAVIEHIDQESVIAYCGMKADTRPEPCQLSKACNILFLLYLSCDFETNLIFYYLL